MVRPGDPTIPMAGDQAQGSLESSTIHLPPPILDQAEKKKGRMRLLRGLSRISSSPSLAQAGRPRSATIPYNSRSSLSCVSLGSPTTPSTPSTSHRYPASPSSLETFSTAPSSRPASPGSEILTRRINSLLIVHKAKDERTTRSAAVQQYLVASVRKRASPPLTWQAVPAEIKIHVLSFLLPQDLARASLVNKEFHCLCFDGQLWSRLDASEFYDRISPDALVKLIESTGPFIKDLNLRGCVQVETPQRAGAIVAACRNLKNAGFEGCQLPKPTLLSLLRANEMLVNINLTGLKAATNTSCNYIADHCPRLQILNVSWCQNLDTRGLLPIIRKCTFLRDLRAGEVQGFSNINFARLLFQTNRLEKLVVCGCDLNDTALKTIVHGSNPEMDFLTDRPLVPPRKLRYLDLSRCSRISNQGIKALVHFLPYLEGLQLNRCTTITNNGLAPLLGTTPRLTHLELEDLSALTNSILSDHLANSPCASVLKHLSVGSCENLGDAGLLPIMKKCSSLSSIVIDNTKTSNLVLVEAASMVKRRSGMSTTLNAPPRVGLRMDIYDCQNIGWAGIREILSFNAEITKTRGADTIVSTPSEVIALKCFYGWQMTVDEHTKRVLRGDWASARRLERKWADFMQANEEAGTWGAGSRRRRRRAREAQQMHADEEGGQGRRRARTCIVM